MFSTFPFHYKCHKIAVTKHSSAMSVSHAWNCNTSKTSDGDKMNHENNLNRKWVKTK